MTRSDYERQLAALSDAIDRLGEIAARDVSALVDRLAGATDATGPEPVDLADDAARASRLRDGTERLCLDIFLLQQPVAADLRIVASSFRAVSDLTRIPHMCDAAADLVAEAGGALHDGIRRTLIAMAGIAHGMLVRATIALTGEDEALAAEVARQDGRLDALDADVRRRVVAGLRDGSLNPEGAPETLMVAKYLERIGDRAVRVASWGAFRETGDHLGSSALAELGGEALGARDESQGWR